MKEKRNPKLKIEEINRRLKDNAKSLMNTWGICPDKIGVGKDQWIKIYFAEDNPDVKYRTIQVLLHLEKNGQITFPDTLLWNGPGYELTVVFRVNQSGLYRLSPWQRVKDWISL